MSYILPFAWSGLKTLYFAHNLGQTALTIQQNKDPLFLEESQKIQAVFDACNFINFLYSSIRILDLCNDYWKVYSYLTFIPSVFLIPGVFLGSFVCLLSSSWFLSAYNTHFLSRTRLNRWLSNINPQEEMQIQSYWYPLTKDELSQTFYIMQIASSISLIFLSSTPLFFTINALLQVYSFMQTSNRNCLRVSITYDQSNRSIVEGPQDWTLVQIFRRNNSQNPQMLECGICLNRNATVSICQDHTYHEDCISNLFYQQIDRLTAHIIYQRTFYTNFTASYRVSYPNQNRICCPLCNIPSTDFPQMRVTDLSNGVRQNILTNLEVIRTD